MSTHTVRFGPVIHGYFRCRSTAGGREACKGVMISAYELEAAAVRAAVRAAVYDAPSGNARVQLVAPRGGMIAPQ